MWGYSGGALATEWAAELQVRTSPRILFQIQTVSSFEKFFAPGTCLDFFGRFLLYNFSSRMNADVITLN